jgi:ribosomal protein S1
MVIQGDIHDLPVGMWGELREELVGCVVEVEVVCVHPFGVGVRISGENCYGHVNSPQVTDGRFTVDEASMEIGHTKPARVISAQPGRQPTLTLRSSEFPPADV